MYKINFSQPVHVHFIGIGGISMSGLAEILLKEGFTISGSDNKESALTQHLASLGATVFYGQKASNMIEGIDLVVYTAAVHEDNEEYMAAVQKGLPMLSRAELLGQLMNNYDMPIAIFRNPWENDNDIHAVPHPSRRRTGSNNFCRRHFKSYRRKY